MNDSDEVDIPEMLLITNDSNRGQASLQGKNPE